MVRVAAYVRERLRDRVWGSVWWTWKCMQRARRCRQAVNTDGSRETEWMMMIFKHQKFELKQLKKKAKKCLNKYEHLDE